MSQSTRTTFVVVSIAAVLLSASNTLADGEGFYESLPNVSIGKVFFSPQQRARLDQRRGNTAAAASDSAAPSGGARKKGTGDAAGFIVSSTGRSKVYANGDFVSDERELAV